MAVAMAKTACVCLYLFQAVLRKYQAVCVHACVMATHGHNLLMQNSRMGAHTCCGWPRLCVLFVKQLNAHPGLDLTEVRARAKHFEVFVCHYFVYSNYW